MFVCQKHAYLCNPFLIILLNNLTIQSGDDQDIVGSAFESFTWIDIENLTEYRQCRNSVQGASLIVDDRGELIQDELFLFKARVV